jgi:hypothetical protein
LEDRRLQPVDRNKIEDEYISKAKAIQNGEFTLVGALGGGFTRWPGSLTAKVMNDILAVWADQSQAQGTFKFNIDVYSDNIVQEAVLKQEDYLVLTDRLRIMIGRISKNLDALASLPGAQLIRVGEHQVSLGELQAALQDSLQFRLTLIQGPIYTFGLFKNRTLAEVYIDENLFRLQLEAQEITSRESALKQALSSYVSSRPGTGRPEDPVPSQGTSSSQLFGGGTVIPQISESFIDRVVNLTTQNTDVAFRQGLAKDAIEIGRKQAEIASERQLYEKMKKALAATDAVSSGSRREEILTNVSQQIDLLIAELKSDLQNVQLLHQEISRRLLQPSMIYSIVMPFYQQRVSVISIRMVGLLAGFAWCVFVGASLVIVAWRAASGAKTSEPLD